MEAIDPLRQQSLESKAQWRRQQAALPIDAKLHILEGLYVVGQT